MQTIDFNRLNVQPKDRILDLGCGEGRHSIGAYTLHKNVEVVGVDISHKDIITAADRFQQLAESNNTDNTLVLALADGLRLPFADNSFDKVLCAEVLEHIPDYYAMLQEINRVLKTDGVLAISVPRAWPERICWMLSTAYHNVKGGHVRIFNANRLHREVETFGLQRYTHHWAHALHVPYWWLKCLFNNKDDSPAVRIYHRFLIWDLMKKPLLTQVLEKLLNPLMGKSIVMYFERKK